MIDIDLYSKLWCYDCKKIFLIPGSTPVVKIKCTHCGSTNWDNQIPTNNLKQKK